MRFLKHTVLGMALFAAGCNPGIAADTFTVSETKTPAMCQASAETPPLPCAFLIAMMNRMKKGCTDLSCANLKTCAVELK